jgi:hypothetical protein
MQAAPRRHKTRRMSKDDGVLRPGPTALARRQAWLSGWLEAGGGPALFFTPYPPAHPLPSCGRRPCPYPHIVVPLSARAMVILS